MCYRGNIIDRHKIRLNSCVKAQRNKKNAPDLRNSQEREPKLPIACRHDALGASEIPPCLAKPEVLVLPSTSFGDLPELGNHESLQQHFTWQRHEAGDLRNLCDGPGSITE